MPTTITMPQLGETVTEGTVAQWLKKVGDVVEKYESFVEVSTDKVNAEVPSPVSGTIRELIVGEGQTVPTGAPIAIIDETVEAARNPAPAPAPARGEPDVAPQHSANGNGNGKVAAGNEPLRGASPAVRRLAREHAVDVAAIRGSGTNGRVTARDVVAAAGTAPAANHAAPQIAAAALSTVSAGSSNGNSSPTRRAASAIAIPGEIFPLTQARRIIAQRMVESKQTAPHAWTMVETDVTNVWKWRLRAKDAFEQNYGVKLTLLRFSSAPSSSRYASFRS